MPIPASLAAPVPSEPALTLTDPTAVKFGWVLASGDVNGDGYSDLAVGDPYWGSAEAEEGRVMVYLGGAAGLDPEPAWVADPTDEGRSSTGLGGWFGWSLDFADVDSDGYDDLLVGAPGVDGVHADVGTAFLYKGSAAGLETSPSWSVQGQEWDERFARTVASAGDVNGDGFEDVLVAAPDWGPSVQQQGRVTLYTGGADGLGVVPQRVWAPTDQAESFFGLGLAAADVDDDGYSDVLVSSAHFDAEATDEGRVYAYRGGPTGPAAAADWFVDPTNRPGAGFGLGLAAADVDGDGFADLLATADGDPPWGGEVHVLRGTPDGFVAATVSEAAVDDVFELPVVAGDIDRDGFDDVLVGDRNSGRVHLFFGSVDALERYPQWTDERPGTYGDAVLMAEDFNGDEFSDIVASDIAFGRVYVRFNREPRLEPISDQTVREGSTLLIDSQATDADGDQVTFEVSNRPKGSSWSPTTGELSWTPGFRQAGVYAGIMISATDGTARTETSFTIRVRNHRAPTRTTASVSKTARWIRVSGRVTPTQSHRRVRVTLLRLRKGRFQRVRRDVRRLDESSTYSTSFRRPRPGACKVRVRFVGDFNSRPSVVRHRFRC